MTKGRLRDTRRSSGGALTPSKNATRTVEVFSNFSSVLTPMNPIDQSSYFLVNAPKYRFFMPLTWIAPEDSEDLQAVAGCFSVAPTKICASPIQV
jgi:hypothetical protein